MAINFNNVTDIMLGQNQVTQIEDSLGNVLWSATPPAPTAEYFYVEDISGADNTLSIVKNNADAPNIEVFKSTDQTTWESMGITSTTAITATIPANGKLYLKAMAYRWCSGGASNCISASGNHNVGGNIMSLLYRDDYESATTLPNNTETFYNLFLNNTYLVNASNLQLPALTLRNSCYRSMFQGCTSLATAPALPATTMNTSCYQSMFERCSSLTTAPALPATTLANACYNNLFAYCTSLTTAPALPATTMALYCYGNMFYGCTHLTTAPALPATTLAQECYRGMFYGCSALTTAPALPATTMNTSCYRVMFYNCTSLTSTPALPATTMADYCYYQMFYGCTSLTTAPELPATTLAQWCYQGMFYGCTSLTTAPALPATTLTNNCYNSMFKGCTSLNSVTTYADDISATDCLSSWLYNVAATGNFHNLGSATYPSGVSGIPTGWTEHTSL